MGSKEIYLFLISSVKPNLKCCPYLFLIFSVMPCGFEGNLRLDILYRVREGKPSVASPTGREEMGVYLGVSLPGEWKPNIKVFVLIFKLQHLVCQIIRSMCDKTRNYKIHSEQMQEMVKVAPIVEK